MSLTICNICLVLQRVSESLLLLALFQKLPKRQQEAGVAKCVNNQSRFDMMNAAAR